MGTENLSAAKRRLLDLLKRTGPSTTASLARTLELTDVAVRQHMAALEENGLVTQEKRPPRGKATPPRGRGRPSILWSLTALAEEIFPDRHAELTVGLIEAAREAFGSDGLKRLIEIRAREQAACYAKILPGPEAPLASRVAALASRRTAEGYMAETVVEEEGKYLLVEHHCPICEAAKTCQGLCGAELDVFRRALGAGVRVERVQHLLSDSDRCAYRIETED